MSVPDNQNSPTRGFYWLGVARIVILQILVLLGLIGAAVRYVNWSSNAAWEEFSGISKPAALNAKAQPRPATPVQAIKRPGACARSA
jgi:hypothetical protein